jgi:hypothetical protein
VSLRRGGLALPKHCEAGAPEGPDYFEFLHDPVNDFRTMTLPFEEGLEFTVRAMKRVGITEILTDSASYRRIKLNA